MGQNENKIIMHLVKLFGNFQIPDIIFSVLVPRGIKTENCLNQYLPGQARLQPQHGSEDEERERDKRLIGRL